MKVPLIVLATLVLSVQGGLAQGTLVFDQQSSNESFVREGAIPFGGPAHAIQSFTPSLDSVGFVRLYFIGFDNAYGVSVNLLAGSPSGSLIGSTIPIDVPGPFTGPLTFYFSTPVTVTPGVTYYLDPVIAHFASGNTFELNASPEYRYPGGTLVGSADYDLWFREGIVVPEPSAATLLLLALGLRFRNTILKT
ncbi:MAG TPA: hypothetical protein VJA21_20130 [Verrucomicrobiae bacterium]